MIGKSRFPLLKKIKESIWHRKDLDFLLMSTPGPDDRLRNRIDWLEDLLQWIRSRGLIRHEIDFKSGAPQAARLRYLLLVLDRNPEWKLRVARILRSIFQDTRAVDLFTEIGLSQQDSFWAEFFSRLNEKILPQPPKNQELSDLVQRNFRNQNDAGWIRAIDDKTFNRLIDLFCYEQDSSSAPWGRLRGDMESAFLLLSYQIQGIGLNADIRKRLEKNYSFKELPFFQLPVKVEKFLQETKPEARFGASAEVDELISACFAALAEVRRHMDDYGVSIQIVFRIERMELMLSRLRNLNYLLQRPEIDPALLGAFTEILINQHQERHSLTALLSENFSLLSRKIAERTAETGEHYITRTREEFILILKKSFGGGFLTSFTTLVRFMVYYLGLSKFYMGVAASLNYSVSFLVIHFAGFTLGTKQPAMTAPALAEKMHEIRNPAALAELIEEIIDLIRSQIAAVFGNVIGVLPFTIAFGLLWQAVFQKTLLGPVRALETLQSFSILGPTPLYAAFTGVLLWLSSILSGWVDNWFAFNQLTAALTYNRRLNFIFGEKNSRKIALFIKKNIAAITAAVSLGFLLGMSPVLLQFLGIPLDVRHVTLSTGSVAAAVISFPSGQFPVKEFWMAVLGVFSMGVLNILVAFSLALFVAIRARKIQAPDRGLIYKAALSRLKSQPLSLFWPKKPTE